MGNAVQLLVGLVGLVIEQQDGTAARGEELFERKNLAPVTQRILGQQPHFGQAVEHHPHRLQFVDPVHHLARRFAQLDFGWVEHRLLRIKIKVVFACQLVDRQRGQVPAMALTHRNQLVGGFGQGDIQAGFAPRHAVEQELQAERGLAGAGRTFDEIHALGRQAATQDVVKAGNTGGNAASTIGGSAVVHESSPGKSADRHVGQLLHAKDLVKSVAFCNGS